MYADIKLGYACNDRCIHCVMEPVRRNLRGHGRRSDATTEEALAMILSAKEQGAKGVVLTGGEPTLRKDFHRLVEQASGLGLSITIQTNGRYLGRQGFLSFLERTPCIRFVVALHGPDDKTHDEVTQVPGSYEETVQGISALVKARKGMMSGKIVISSKNAPRIAETVALFASLGVSDVCIAFPHVDGFESDEIKRIVPRYSEIAKYLHEAIQEAVSRQIDLLIETVPYCVMPRIPDVWEYSQDARYAAQRNLQAPSIDAFSLEKVEDWNQERRQIKAKFDRCRQCVFDLVCEGPWMEYADVYGPAEFVPVSDAES